MSIRVKDSKQSGVASIGLAGALTSGPGTIDARSIGNQLLELGSTKLIINMARVSEIDSGGLGFLFSLNAKARNRSARLILVDPTEKVDRFLQIAGFFAPFEIVRANDGLPADQHRAA